MPQVKTNKNGRGRRAAKSEVRLVLPPASHSQGLSDVLKSAIDDWLVPQLVDAFVREMAFGNGGEMFRPDHPTELPKNQPSLNQFGELNARQ
jgi:hypothetical protein